MTRHSSAFNDAPFPPHQMTPDVQAPTSAAATCCCVASSASAAAQCCSLCRRPCGCWHWRVWCRGCLRRQILLLDRWVGGCVWVGVCVCMCVCLSVCVCMCMCMCICMYQPHLSQAVLAHTFAGVSLGSILGSAAGPTSTFNTAFHLNIQHRISVLNQPQHSTPHFGSNPTQDGRVSACC